MTFGRYDISCIDAGHFRLDGGAMFGVVPKTLWNRTLPADGMNRIAMMARLLLIRGEGRTVLVDAGIGGKLNDKLLGIYAVEFPAGSLIDRLNAAGVSAKSVTDVFLTHLHFDHCGGTTASRNGETVPIFPRATHYVQRPQWDWANAPSERDRASFMPENFRPLESAGLLTLLDGPEEVLPDIRLEVVHGHTFAQQLVRVSDGARSMVFCGDLVPTSAHVPAPYIMGYDLQPLVTLREKHEMLDTAVLGGDILVFEHDPAIEAATVRRTEKGYSIAESGTLDDMLRRNIR
jgi:glyoxylase-like metal-dependent hydrolase (beta-lactamase superfamily II)